MKKKCIWLTSSKGGDIKNLKIDPKSPKEVEDKNLDECLWWEENEQAEAKDFLRDLKDCMRHLYCDKYKHQERAKWMNDNWVNE